MSRDVGTFSEAKAVQSMLESRESGHDSAPPAPSSMSWKETFKGGKTQPTLKSFSKPGIGSVRKHLE
jgi:hypothetical protein